MGGICYVRQQHIDFGKLNLDTRNVLNMLFCVKLYSFPDEVSARDETLRK